jgi:tetratricopeptide (TPR) repeat protein
VQKRSRSRGPKLISILLLLGVAAVVIPTSAQFLPRPPKDPRAERAKSAFEAGRYQDAADLLSGYVERNPSNAEAWLFLGWSRYRLGQFEQAQSDFERSLDLAPSSADATVGLGYASLQLDRPEAAARLFERALEIDRTRGDALRGIVLAARRRGAPDWLIREGAIAARKLEALEGVDVDTLLMETTLRAGRERRLRPPTPRETPAVRWRAGTDYLEQRIEEDLWRPLFVKGVNLGTTLPGRYPSDFPRELKLYQEWLDHISSLGANTVRIYTLLPPAFYQALALHNDQPETLRLWLIQGIWMEPPADGDLFDPEYMSGIRQEISRTIDAVHGNIALGPRQRGAWGGYNRDVSSHLLAYIIGRNWEPFIVKEFNDTHSNLTEWHGEWFEVRDARAMECWIAMLCDFTADYEASQHGVIHPLSFANWPTLDPLEHPSEATRAEENAWRERAGLPPLDETDEPWEDDAVTLDATAIFPSERMEAGFFASYQVFPNFPSFMSHEYAEAGEDGRSGYARYLNDLKDYHGAQPVVVVELGISTSRGISHVHSDDKHHGGHDERSQGELVASMIRDVHEERMAGGIVYSLFDEWFRSTWNTAPFERPTERGVLWLNMQSPEQSYGLFATRPGSFRIRVDGDATEWSEHPIYAQR